MACWPIKSMVSSPHSLMVLSISGCKEVEGELELDVLLYKWCRGFVLGMSPSVYLLIHEAFTIGSAYYYGSGTR